MYSPCGGGQRDAPQALAFLGKGAAFLIGARRALIRRRGFLTLRGGVIVARVHHSILGNRPTISPVTTIEMTRKCQNRVTFQISASWRGVSLPKTDPARQ